MKASTATFFISLFIGTFACAQVRLADSLYQQSKKFWYNNTDSGKLLLRKALQASRTAAYLKGEANALKGLGFLAGSNTERLKYYFQALTIRQQLNDSLGMGISLFDIGFVYREMGEQGKAESYHTRALAIRRKINDHGGIAQSLIELGHREEDVGNLPKALNTYRESLDHRLKVGETNGIAFSHINLATVYAKLKQPDSALYYCLIAETEFKKANNQQTAGWISWIRGYSFLQKNETERAINELKKIEQFNAHFLPGVLLLSDIYEKKKDFRQAFEYQKKWINENKIREEQSNVRAMREIAADYEYKIKQAELIRKEEVERLKKKRIDNLQLMLIAIGLIGSFIFILSVRKNFSERTVNVLFFVGFMFLFEFVVLLIDPALQNLSGNKPVFLLLGNTLVALLLAPLHGFVERYFKKKIKPDSIEII